MTVLHRGTCSTMRRLPRARSGGSNSRFGRNKLATTTTTYAYGPFGERVSETSGGTTTVYPSKYYSVVTNGTNFTSTDFVYAGSNLLATIDQKMVSGTATGTPITRLTSDKSMNQAQWFDYAPYGGVELNPSIEAELLGGHIRRAENSAIPPGIPPYRFRIFLSAPSLSTGDFILIRNRSVSLSAPSHPEEDKRGSYPFDCELFKVWWFEIGATLNLIMCGKRTRNKAMKCLAVASLHCANNK